MFVALSITLLLQAPASSLSVGDGSEVSRDSVAAAILAGARNHRRLIDRSITRYRTLSRERISVGVRTVGREHLAARKEVHTRVDWRRDGPIRVEVMAARETSPLVDRVVRVGGLENLWLAAFDPAEERLNLNLLDSAFVYHPFAEGSEAEYRFRSGDTISMRLGDGPEIRLLSLDVQPRVEDVHHLGGTLWVEAVSYALVRAVFRLGGDVRLARYDSSVVLDFRRDATARSERWLPPLLKQIRGKVAWFTLEYGLWEGRWWMPRRIAMEADVSMGHFVEVPIRYERTYSDYQIEGDTTELPVARTPISPEVQDSIAAACRVRQECVCWAGGCRTVDVVIPSDTLSLVTSHLLESSIWAEDWVFGNDGGGEDGRKALVGDLPEPPWQLATLQTAWGFGGSGLVRYNRVEGLSVGARTELGLGPVAIEGVVRLGLADLVPGVELGLTRDGGAGELRLEGYRRLSAMNAGDRPLGIGNSLGALFAGRDDGEYYRATGIEVRRHPAQGENGLRVEWRVWAERQRPANTEADFTVKSLWGDQSGFRPPLAADAADQVGAAVEVRRDFGADPLGWRGGVGFTVDGSVGTYDFGRAGLTLRGAAPLPGPLLGSAEVGAGTSRGGVPIQSGWFLGGPATVRGYDGGTGRGDAYWRGRAQAETEGPAVRLSLFADAAWAGDRRTWSRAPGLTSVGVGMSFLDNLIRVDLARALKGPVGWRLDIGLGRSP